MAAMVGNPYRWQSTISQLENRNATAGCLLTVLFVVPYLAKYGEVGTLWLTTAVLIYVGLIVPLMTGILSKRTLISAIRGYTGLLSCERWADFVTLVWFFFEWAHYLYMNVEGIHLTTMHVMFNLALEKTLCPNDRFCSLYVLLFYLVIAYLLRSLESHPWTHLPATRYSGTEIMQHTAAFVIVRLGKAMVMSLVLLTFSMQFEYMEPSVSYVALTFLYFCLTQYQKDQRVLKILSERLSSLRIRWLEGMEELWVPLFLNFFTIAYALCVGLCCFLYSSSFIIALIFCYTNIVTPTCMMIKSTWAPLMQERRRLSQFPKVSADNPEIRSGGLCAICLEKLSLFSRVTKCRHVFHTACLRTSLLYSSKCPLCKATL